MRLEKVIEMGVTYLLNKNFVSEGKRIQILSQYAREEGIAKDEAETAKFIAAFDVDLTKELSEEQERKLAEVFFWYYVNYMSDLRPEISKALGLV